MDDSLPWSEIIMRSFFIAGASTATSEKPFYGPWNRVLNTVFHPDTIFEIVLQFHPVTARETVDFVVLLVVCVNSTPVFVIDHPQTSDLPRSVKKLTSRLRQCFLDIHRDMKIPVLHAVSAFGTKIAFYQYDKEM